MDDERKATDEQLSAEALDDLTDNKGDDEDDE